MPNDNNESKSIATSLYTAYVINHANHHYQGDVSKMTPGELSDLAKLGMIHAKHLDTLNEFEYR